MSKTLDSRLTIGQNTYFSIVIHAIGREIDTSYHEYMIIDEHHLGMRIRFFEFANSSKWKFGYQDICAIFVCYDDFDLDTFCDPTIEYINQDLII